MRGPLKLNLMPNHAGFVLSLLVLGNCNAGAAENAVLRRNGPLRIQTIASTEAGAVH